MIRLHFSNETETNWELEGDTSDKAGYVDCPIIVESESSEEIAIMQVDFASEAEREAYSVIYKICGSDKKIAVSIENENSNSVMIKFINFKTDSGDTYIAKADEQDNAYFIMYEKLGEYYTQPGWLDNRICDLCILGSHDSGMHKVTNKTANASFDNTVTQYESIGIQIMMEVCYFDIRPVLDTVHDNKFYTGHFGENPVTGWEGSTGQSIESMVTEINSVAKLKKDMMVFLNLSHGYRWYKGSFGITYCKPLDQSEWNRLFEELSKINDLFIADPSIDLSKLTLRDYYGKKPSVIIIVEDSMVQLGSHFGKGFFKYSSLNVYNSYSDKDHTKDMAADQIKKMKKFHSSGRVLDGHNMFLLSWTMTQSTWDAMHGLSILELAKRANAEMEGYIDPIVSKSLFPNIIYMDGIMNKNPIHLCTRINGRIAKYLS